MACRSPCVSELSAVVFVIVCSGIIEFRFKGKKQSVYFRRQNTPPELVGTFHLCKDAKCGQFQVPAVRSRSCQLFVFKLQPLPPRMIGREVRLPSWTFAWFVQVHQVFAGRHVRRTCAVEVTHCFFIAISNSLTHMSHLLTVSFDRPIVYSLGTRLLRSFANFTPARACCPLQYESSVCIE